MTTIFDAMLKDPTGRWFVYVGIALGMVLLVVGAGAYAYFRYVKPWLNAFNDKLDIVKDNVANDHTSNMRDEADTRHDSNAGKLDLLVDMVRGQGSSIDALQRGQTSLYSLIVGNTTDIDALQKAFTDTHTRDEVNKIIGDNHDGKHAQPYPGNA